MVADKTATGGGARRHPGRGRARSRAAGAWAFPKNVDPAKKAAAWRALTWITNKKTNIYEIEKYQIDANRTSAFADPELLKQFPYLPDSAQAIAVADIIPTSKIDEFFQLNDVMNVEFNKALIGGQDAKTACANVQKQWEAILRKAGHLA